MRVKIFRDKSGNIESVAMLHAAPSGRFHIEVEGSTGTAQEIEVDDGQIEPEALLGRRGPEAQKAAHEKLLRLAK